MSRTIIAVVDDLFFASKIRGAGEQCGVSVSFARSKDALIETALRDHSDLIICDLHSHKIDPIELAKSLKADPRFREIRLLGFFSHVQVELQREAEQAGFDRVIPRSAFSNNLAKILAGD